MPEPKQEKHSTFQVVMAVITVAVAIILAFTGPVFTGALGDIKSNEQRLDGLTTQQALTKQNRVYMEKRFNALEGNIEFLGERMENVVKALNNFIISYDEKGRLVGHAQPKGKRRIL